MASSTSTWTKIAWTWPPRPDGCRFNELNSQVGGITNPCLCVHCMCVCACSIELRTHIFMVMMTKPKGLLMLAPPCGSYSWMFRFSTGRRAILPNGLPSEKVAVATKIAARMLDCNASLSLSRSLSLSPNCPQSFEFMILYYVPHAMCR